MKQKHSFFRRKLKQDKEYNDQLQRRQHVKKARKFVIFEKNSGKLVFQYGGVKDDPFKCVGRNGQYSTIYQLDMIVKELRIENFRTKIMMFYAGDILNKEEKERICDTSWNWGMGFISVALDELLKLPNQKTMDLAIKDAISKNILETSESHLTNNYPFNPDWIQG